MNDEEKKTVQDRLHSKYVWIAIISQVVVLVTLINPDVANVVKIVLTCVCEILTSIGVLNNPTDKENW
jgi:uncharacterized membrane protein